MAITRRPLIRNLEADRWTVDASLNLEAVNQFHSHLPGYEPTPLIALPNIAKELGVGTVHLKDESKRLGLPSFKILGASWGAFRAVAQRLDLPPDASLQTVKDAASSSSSLALFAATDGNHGRAVARMGAILGLPVRIFVPRGMHAATIALIEGEGAVVLQTSLSYDEAVQLAFATSKEQSGILVQDTAFAGYTTVPEVRDSRLPLIDDMADCFSGLFKVMQLCFARSTVRWQRGNRTLSLSPSGSGVWRKL